LVIAVSGAALTTPITNPNTLPTTDRTAIEMNYWDSIKNSTNAEDFKAYLQKYPNGEFADLAKIRVRSLGSAETGNEAKATSEPGGVGVRIEVRSNQVFIAQVTPGGVAARAGLKADDQITRINQQSANNLTIDNIVEIVRGNAGTRVTLTVLSPGATSERDIILVREGFSTDVKAVNQGDDLMRLGKCAEAEPFYRTAVQSVPGSPFYHEGLGLSLTCQDQLAGAEAELRDALRLAGGTGTPDQARIHSELGYFLWVKAKRLPEAEAEYRQAIRLQPTNGAHHAQLGGILVSLQQMSEAEREAREAIRLDPNGHAGHRVLGVIIYAKSDWAGAEVEFRQALRLNPLESSYHYNLSLALRMQKKWAEAEAEAREALQREPNNASYKSQLDAVIKRQT